MSHVLEYSPGADVYVRNTRTGEQEVATADEDGVVRDAEGRPYGDGPYAIIGEADDAE